MMPQKLIEVFDGGIMGRTSYPPRLIVEVNNFGLKSLPQGAPFPKADLYLDARNLPDGARIIGEPLIPMTLWELSPHALRAHIQTALESLRFIEVRRRDHDDPFATPWIITCFCAYGQNRSKALKTVVAEGLTLAGVSMVRVGPTSPCRP